MANQISRDKSLRLPAPLGVRLLRGALHAAEDWPVAGTAVRRLQAVEDWALEELKQRLDELERPADGSRDEGDTRGELAAMLSALLREASHETLAQARRRSFRSVLAQLCPDQARMLAVLADGRQAPLCHVGAGLPAGAVREYVLCNATNLGRDGGVTQRDRVPVMVGQMRDLGLLDIGPEEPRLRTAYEILETDENVRRAVAQVRDGLRLWPRLIRRTVGLSQFGRELWEAARPGPADV